MTGFIIFIHSIVCILLAVIILMQSGRGGGLTEGFAAAESMFGAQTNQFLIKSTTIISTVFLVTCLSLAFLSAKKDKSLMADKVATQTDVTQEVEAKQEVAVPEPEPTAPLAETP